MSDSAGTPGSGSNSTTSPPPNTKGSDGTTNSTTPGSSGNSTTPEQSKAPPPSSDNNEKGNNNSSSSASPPSTNSPPSPPPSNGSSTPASPPPQSSPPPLSPPPSSPPPSSPPPSSPPPSSSSSPSPPPSSPPPAESQKSPPPSSNSNQPSPSPNPPSPPPPEKSNSSPSDGNDNTESPPTWSPPPPPQSTAASPPPPSTTDVGNQPTPANTTSNALSPPIKSGASTPKRGNTADTSPTKSNSSSSSTTQQATIVGASVAGVFLVAFIAIFFVVRGRRKKRDAYAAHYMPPPNNYSGNSGGYYYSHSSQHPMQHSGPVDPFFGSQGQPLPFDNSYGSQKGYGGGPDSSITSSKTHFSYEEMMEITNGFSRENVIGEGGFGCVYKGQVSDGRIVAIKQLKAGSGQGEREFRAEVEIISRVHHRHLVSLVGYCIHDRHRLLIYEFVPNNTLEHHLHSKGLPVLDWVKRVKIAIGSAKGLAYLHEDCHPKIIHRDIKSANILLDDDFEAQVADFGLARLNDTSQTHVSTRVMGTFGYLAPEYASSGKLTDRSDVFSFGVVLLELITGRKPVDASQPLGDESLVEWARPLLNQALETGDISELVDPRLEKHYVEIEMFRMIEAAAACVRHSAPKRPRMVKVVRALDCDGDMSDLSNGVKYGQSTIYDSGQYNREILKFRMMALGTDESSEFSGDYSSPSAQKSQEVSTDFSESETRAINQSRFGRQF